MYAECNTQLVRIACMWVRIQKKTAILFIWMLNLSNTSPQKMKVSVKYFVFWSAMCLFRYSRHVPEVGMPLWNFEMCQLLLAGMMIIIIIIRNLYSAIMPLGGYRGASLLHELYMFVIHQRDYCKQTKCMWSILKLNMINSDLKIHWHVWLV